MNWLKTPKQVFFVRGREKIPCPCCGAQLKVIGSRPRRVIDSGGESIILIIRRLRCQACNRIHHELPDILVPYKRYRSDCIEAVVIDRTAAVVAVDESTLYRWRRWFAAIAKHLIGCLRSIAIRYGHEPATEQFSLPPSPLRRIWLYVGDAPFWLARAVRPVVNTNNWVQTRSVFLS